MCNELAVQQTIATVLVTGRASKSEGTFCTIVLLSIIYIKEKRNNSNTNISNIHKKHTTHF